LENFFDEFEVIHSDINLDFPTTIINEYLDEGRSVKKYFETQIEKIEKEM
jgi:hypothetical protein